MDRNNTARVVGLIVAAAIIIAAWIIQPIAPWNLLVTIPISVIGTLLIMSVFAMLGDERFAHIMNLSSRNCFVFLVFALPWMGAMIALDVIVLDALGACLALWIASVAIRYISGTYYYMK